MLALVALSLGSGGCLSKTTRVPPPPVAVRTATLDDLLARLDRFKRLQSMQATVDMQLSFLNDEQTKRTDLTDVRGFVLAERPGFSRIQAQYPVTRAKAFDMASDGKSFRVYLVWKKRFFEGATGLDVRSKKRTENIRPQHIVEPLMIEPPRDDEWKTLVNEVENRRPFHVVLLQERMGDQQLRVRRKVWFDRSDLRLARLELFNDDGDRATIASYQGWQESEGIPYPTTVRISRPLDGYSLTLTFLEPGLNAELAENAFELEAPKNVDVEYIQPPNGEEEAEGTASASAP